MRKLPGGFAAAIVLATGPALADLPLAQSKNCMVCHAADRKVVGPSYRDVAAKYAGQMDAVDKLAARIRQGGAGAWGTLPMPAYPLLTAADARTLAAWVMSTE